MAERRVVFIPDKLNQDAVDLLAKDDLFEIDYRPSLSVEEKHAAVARAHGVILRSATKIDAAFIEAASQLELIVRAGVGVDNVDLDAATRRGIVVQNVPEGNTRSAAEHTIALLLALARNVPQAARSLAEEKWERSKFVGVELQGKDLGVIGLGKIGRHVVDMARGLGCRIHAFDPFVSPAMAEQLGLELVDDVGELAARSDFLTVHVPKLPQTIGLISAELIEKARPGIRILNCARGGIVDEEALLAGLESGKVAGAALDVFAEEPPTDFRLAQHPRVVATPHLGASTVEAQVNVAIAASELVQEFFHAGKLSSPVNAVGLDPELRDELEPHGRMARALGRLHAQLLDGNPERIVVRFYGTTYSPAARGYLSSSVLEGFLEGSSAHPVNRINARLVAQDQGLAVEEIHEGQSQYFSDLLKVEVSDRSGNRVLGGAIRGRRGLRLVSLDSYHFDAVLEGTLLIAANEDRPGMIGALGQTLAAHGINISYMSLGRDESGGTAVSVLNIDGEVSPEVLEALKALDGLLWVRLAHVD